MQYTAVAQVLKNILISEWEADTQTGNIYQKKR